MRNLVVLMVLVGCGDDGGSGMPSIDAPAGTDAPASDAAIDAQSAAFSITSPTITQGQPIPLTHVCANHGGQNQSPQLVFTNIPSGTMSFAVVLTDKTNTLVHSAIYDIPYGGGAAGLVADIDKVYAPTDAPGAHQTASYQSAVRGYNGPCPGSLHTYEFKIYAIATAALPNATMATTKETVVTTATAANLGTAMLSGTFTP